MNLGKAYVSNYVWLCKKDKNFAEACKHNNIVSVRHIFEWGVDTDINNALSEAISHERFDIIKYCIRKNANVNICDGYALRISAHLGNLEIIRYLVEVGKADIQPHYKIILETSARCNYLSIIEYCVEKGADLYSNNNVLDLSARYDNLAIVKYYLGPVISKLTQSDPLSKVERIYKEIYDALHISTVLGHLSITKYCIKLFTKVTRCNSDIKFEILPGSRDIYVNLNKLLHNSVKFGNLAVTKYLITCSDNVRASVDMAVPYCIEHGRLAILKHLIKQGASPNVDIDEELQTGRLPIKIDVIKYIVNQGAKIKDVNKIINANIANGPLSLIRFLLENGADRDATVVAAVKYGRYLIVKEFIKQGVPVNTIIRACVEHHSYKIIKHLAKNENNRHAILLFSIEFDRLYMIKHLVTHNVDINAHNNEALSVCTQHNHLHIWRYLIKNSNRNKTLWFLVEHGNLNMFKYLVAYYNNDVHYNNNAILCTSIRHGHIDMIKYLARLNIRSGANITIVRDGSIVKFKTKYKHLMEYLSDHVDKLRVISNKNRNIIIAADTAI
jgi:ankyrin repeat protein